MSGDVSDDLIPQLLEKAEWRNDVHSDLHRKAATALEAKEAEIAALKWANKVYSEQTEELEARAETAERRVAELEASALAVENAKLKQWIELHRGDTLSLSNEVDHFREELAEAERERDEARAALKAFLPDPTMMDILWGDMDDEATGTHTMKLKHFRAARAVIEKE